MNNILARLDRKLIDGVLDDARRLYGSSFWKVPRERTLDDDFEGFDLWSGQHHRARLWDNGSAWPSLAVVAVPNDGQGQPDCCCWCKRIARGGWLRPQPGTEELTNMLCPYHVHYALTGERLLPQHVTQLTKAQKVVKYEWTWSHGIAFIRSRAGVLPLGCLLGARTAPIAAGLWLIETQLSFEASMDQLRVAHSAGESQKSHPSEYGPIEIIIPPSPGANTVIFHSHSILLSPPLSNPILFYHHPVET